MGSHPGRRLSGFKGPLEPVCVRDGRWNFPRAGESAGNPAGLGTEPGVGRGLATTVGGLGRWGLLGRRETPWQKTNR